MEKPSTRETDDFRRNLLSKLDDKRLTIESATLSMVEAADVLRLLLIECSLECPDDQLFRSITEAGGEWWKMGPAGGHLLKLTRVTQGVERAEPWFEARVRLELREYVARVISLLREI